MLYVEIDLFQECFTFWKSITLKLGSKFDKSDMKWQFINISGYNFAGEQFINMCQNLFK